MEGEMYALTSGLIVYNNIPKDSILFRLSEIIRRSEEGDSPEKLREETLVEIHRLLDLATSYGFDNNLWHNYLAYLIAVTETPFTLVSEKTGAHDGSVNIFAKHDLYIMKMLFDYDFSEFQKYIGSDCFDIIENFQAMEKEDRIYNKSVSEKVRELSSLIEKAKSDDEIFDIVTDFYRRYGVGKLGLNKAFRLSDDPARELLIPITNTSTVTLNDLVGYEAQKKALVENIEAFVAGRNANNVLLYGDAGTGKSTSVKAVLNQFYPDGLRMIEIYKHQFEYLSRIISMIKNRNYRFIIYMDDLSFEESELEYKYLKAVIEGGLEPKPDNVLILATSNRRNLVRESWKDRSDQDDEDIHRNDTVQEKLSLSARFGLRIGYFRPSPKEYLEIVRTLAKKYPDISLSDDELRIQANAWEMKHGGFSGRTAQQFVDYLAGTIFGKNS
jgi:predicted AAA+ superfamily ATPase